MSAAARYYYVDARNQAAGPVAMDGLLALHAAGTVTDASLVVIEGGTEWVAFSSLRLAVTSPKPLAAAISQPVTIPAPVSLTTAGTTPGGSTPSGAGALRGLGEGELSAAQPPWAAHLTQKIEQLTAVMDRLAEALEKTRPGHNPAPGLAPATAALHAEKINLNPSPKPGIAALNPSAPGPGPARPGVGTTLSPLAVPANAQKSALPLPALGTPPGPASANPRPAQGNIFSKFLKK